MAYSLTLGKQQLRNVHERTHPFVIQNTVVCFAVHLRMIKATSTISRIHFTLTQIIIVQRKCSGGATI